MGILLVLLATLGWSLVGILVKLANTMVDTSIITFARFAIGVIFLAGLLLIKDGKISLRSNMKWIWLGAAGKSCNYLFENVAISMGYAYGNIIVSPIQMIALMLISLFWLREKISRKGWYSAVLCLVGIVLISWNGQPLELYMENSLIITLLFGLSALGSAVHVLSQKMLIKSMDSGNMNFSVFFWASIMTAIPLPVYSDGMIGPVTVPAVLALAGLGLITGLSFYSFAEGLRRVDFSVAVIISNSMVLFTIIWSYVFFKEPITLYIIAGAMAFIIGLVWLNLPSRAQRVKIRDDTDVSTP
ncbi:DMT family transporter [Paenibacillus senegalensis]|uniref:DMT family transporter n=1 Tax=Paenibacillus senegalensis TaxID=1465766 RepID=UPI000288F41C|nr:DMT family transporter [Paenibacillus senegalensis]